jgi:hypothetical protein
MSLINSDTYRSPSPDELHGRLDNYQIYSIGFNDQSLAVTTTSHDYAINFPPVDVLTSRTITFQEEPNTSPVIQVPSRGVTVRYYSRLIPGVAGLSYSELLTIGLQYRGDDDPERTIARELPGQSIVNFDLTGWNLDGENVSPDLPFSHQYRTVFTENITYGYSPETNLSNRPLSIVSIPSTEAVKATVAVAFQSFSPKGRVPFDFSNLIDRYPVTLLSDGQRSDYTHLISGHPLDPRTLPDSITVTATSSRKIKYGYYRKNPRESHPKISSCLDWRAKEINAVAGKAYRLSLTDPVLGTLVTDSQTREELLGAVIAPITPGKYPVKYLFSDELPELLTYWNTLYPVSPPNGDGLLASAYTWADPSDPIPALVYVVRSFVSMPIVSIMAANNDRWRHGIITTAKNRPPDDHPIFQLGYQELFENLQTDGSYGTYMVDSPRLLEIHAALQADYYGAPVDGQLPVVNYRVLAEKIAALLGYRPERASGKHDVTKEKKRIRKLFTGEESNQNGQYGGNYFGDEGLLVRRVPNQFTKDGSIEQGGFVGVPDIPHLLKEVLDQLSIAIGGQESGAIEIKDGDATRRYPNQLELLKDVALAASSIHRLAHQQFVSSIVTQQQTGEIISGLGLPTVLKNTTVVTDNKIKPLPYWGISPSHSVGKKLDNLLYHDSIIIGQIT